MHPKHRLSDRSKSVGEVELRLHDSLEQIRGLAEDDSVYVVHRHLRVFERPEDGLAHHSAHRHVAAAGPVMGLTDPDDSYGNHDRPSRMQMRFCCKQGPLVACASDRAPPPKMCSAA